MAAEKRKADRVAKKPSKSQFPSSDESRPAKRQRKDQAFKKAAAASTGEALGDLLPRRPLKPSILTQEERSFPRGGASALTPLETKQIRAQATRDVLFEESGTKRLRPEIGGEEDLDDTVQDAHKPRAVAKKQKKSRAKKNASGTLEEPLIRVSSLKFKHLTPGLLLLGRVANISTDHILLDLPNNLTGYVSITNISRQLTAQVEVFADRDENASNDSESSSTQEVDLNSLFYIGQYLRACVISTEDAAGKSDTANSRKKIELSIDPRHVNGTISWADIPTNSMIQASVASIEDHGLLMDVGSGDTSKKGFILASDIGDGIEYSQVRPGSVHLCLVTGRNSSGTVIKLSTATGTAGAKSKPRYIPETSSVDALLPGLLVEVVISQVSDTTIAGTIMGLATATADIFHSGSGTRLANEEHEFKIGGKVRARIHCTFPDAPSLTVGVSILDHVVALSSQNQLLQGSLHTTKSLSIGSFVENAKIIRVVPNLGVFTAIEDENCLGFVHLSRMTDARIETLSSDSGPFKLGTSHRGRVLGFNSLDGLFLLSFEKSILEQPFLRIEDIPLGKIVKAKVEKLIIDGQGRGGLVLQVAEGIRGFVREMHFADIHLQHPDRKFRLGTSVTGRVLSTDAERRQVNITLKKSLVNTELPVWSKFDDIQLDTQSIGTIGSFNDQGAVVRFYGNVKAFLPVSEMSETYIKEPAKHFHVGQAITVRAVSVDLERNRVTVSCRDPTTLSKTQDKDFKSLKVGDIVSGNVMEKSAEDITIELQPSGLKATLRATHLSDASNSKNASKLTKIRVGQQLNDLVVLELFEKRHSVVLTSKPSLCDAAKTGCLLSTFDSLKSGQKVNGFVSGVIHNGVFVKFAGGLTGFLPKMKIADELKLLPNFGLTDDKSLSARIVSVDHDRQQFTLSMRQDEPNDAQPNGGHSASVVAQNVQNPVDGNSTSVHDFTIGKLTKARISSVRDTQLNVQLGDNLFGRIDASEAFDNWEQIKDRKYPLKVFRVKQILPVRVIGVHDAKNHRFLPISHRGSKTPVVELSAKMASHTDTGTLTLDQLKVGSSYTAFVNNVSDMCLWVNLSPECRGRIERVEISDDVSLLNDLEANFPPGSAMKVRVTNIDVDKGRLDLSARSSGGDSVLTFDNLTSGTIVTGRVTKITARSVMVQLSSTIAGHVGLTELADDYSLANPHMHTKNEIVKVCVLNIDPPNKKVILSMRPSKVLSSSLPVQDRSITSLSQLEVKDVVRGFIKQVADVGLFITLSDKIDAFVRVAEMSDTFMKDWKSNFEVDRLVTGRVISVDEGSKQVQLSLKPSVVDKNFVPRTTFNDLEVGQVVTGKVREVKDFGAFIVVDNSHNVSGLCHRSEIAEKRVSDVTQLYSIGDVVRAKILTLDAEKRRISFGLKASYFKDALDFDDESDEGVDLSADVRPSDELEDANDDEGLESGGVAIETIHQAADLGESIDANDSLRLLLAPAKGLNAGGFNWDGDLEQGENGFKRGSESESEQELPKKKRKKAPITTDQTGDLDKFGPQSTDDFERLLLGQPNSSELWLQYMAFQLELGDVDSARQLAERALTRINITEQEEKLNIWTAYLNLEVQYGDDETVEDVFKRAREFNDAQEIHERLASIYITADKLAKADDLFQVMTKTKAFTPDPKLWANYATFLFDTMVTPERGRDLLDRAMKSVPSHAHRDLVTRFAQLEFRCKNGDAERGRTIFEGLLDTYPKRGDLWDVFVDLERHQKANENVRRLFGRMTTMAMKRKRARFVFQRWRAFEEAEGGQKRVEHVKLKEAQYEATHKAQ